MEFKIAEFDNDYNSLIRILFKEFESKKEAEEWCRAASWSGADYMILEDKTKNV